MGQLPKFLPFRNCENVPFELLKTLCWFSGRILPPKPLFALVAMTQGEEFEQCVSIVDSFPVSENHLQTDKSALKSSFPLWFRVSQSPTDTVNICVPDKTDVLKLGLLTYSGHHLKLNSKPSFTHSYKHFASYPTFTHQWRRQEQFRIRYLAKCYPRVLWQVHWPLPSTLFRI